MINQSVMPSHLIPRRWLQPHRSKVKLRRLLLAASLAAAAFTAASSCSFAAASDSKSPDDDDHRQFGYIDKTGRFVIEPIYELVTPFSEDCALVKCEKELRLIDKSGKVIFKRDTGGVLASVPGPFKDGLSVTNKGNVSGYVDKTGQFVIEAKYCMARDFSEGVAAVATTDPNNEWAPMSWSFIDKSGKTVIAGPFQLASSFSQGLAAVQVDRKWGYIDHSGKFVIPAKYLSALSFSENLAAVQDVDSQFHYINRTGAPAFDETLGIATPFSEGVACYGKKFGKMTGLVDTHGKTIDLQDTLGAVPIGQCSGGLVPIISGDACGFVNAKGKIVIKPTFDGTLGFTEGLAAVHDKDKWSFIDPSGQVVIKPAFSEAQSFSEGLAGASADAPAK